MPQNIAEFRIIGRIGKITAREKVTYVSVAANYNRRDGDNWKTDTLWNSVVCFSNVATQVEAAGKGDLVHVTGRVRESNHGEGNDVSYTTQPFERAASDMDVVFDTVGGDAFERAFLTVKKGGFVVTSVAFPTDEGKRHCVGVARVQCKPDAAELALMRAMVEEGKLAAHIARVLPLAHIKEALALSEAGHTRGKIVLQIAE
jgi:single-strand DNA-binding protein